MTKVLSSLLLLASAAVPAEQPYEISWVRQFGTTGRDEPYSAAGDKSGNIYVVGRTSGSLVAGQESNGGDDAFLAKYDSAGTLVWTRQFGTAGDDEANSVIVDNSGNVYVSGTTWGVLEEDQPHLGGYDAYVARFDEEGTLLWVNQFGSDSTDVASSVVTDNDGNIYVGGTTLGAIAGGQGSHGLLDAFIARFNSDGTEIWIEQFGTSSHDYINYGAAATDSNGNLYVAGTTSGTFEGQTRAGYRDAFVAKYDGDGNRRWIRQFGTPDMEETVSIATGSDCSLYVTGDTLGTFEGQTSGGGYDAYVMKFDGDSTQLWIRQFGSDTADGGYSIATDGSGNVYVAGATLGSLDGQTQDPDGDAFLAKYDAIGNLAWLNQFGTDDTDGSTFGAMSVVSSGTHGVYVTGRTFGTFEGETNSGWVDAFLAKFVAPFTSTSEIINQTIAFITTLPDSSFKEPDHRHTLENKLYAVLTLIADGNSLEALDKLSGDILTKTDGCILRGIADKQDWIESCDTEVGQPPVYSSIIEAISILEKNLQEGA